MNYIKISEAAEKWGLSPRMVRKYCKNGRIAGVVADEDGWLIPENAVKPERKKYEAAPREKEKAPYLANKLQKEKTKKRYHGLYDYTQENFTYSNNRLASNRLMRNQVVEIMKTGKVTTCSEPAKIDDLIEITNHVVCFDYILETVMQPITQTYIKKLHKLLLYGTMYDRTHEGLAQPRLRRRGRSTPSLPSSSANTNRSTSTDLPTWLSSMLCSRPSSPLRTATAG